MRKLMLIVGLVMSAAFAACADTVYTTNVVVVVSNIYNRISTEHWITNNVKNTHANYFETNHVYTIDHQTLVVERTNTTVNVDVSQQAIDAARAQADRAEDAVDDARGFASTAAGSASSAASSASSASSYANQAASQRSAAASECATALQTINNRIAWFDEHSGETITMVDNSTNYVVYVPEQDYSYPYVDAQGREYNYVTIHPYNVNGKVSVAARSSSSYNTVTFRAWPAQRLSGWWDFYPAYIDNDEYGMRIQYLPTTTEPIMYGDSSSAYPNGKQVPEYFYWQNGYIYFKVRVWVNGRVVAWCISRYQYNNYPTTINYGTDTGTAMTLVDRELYGPSSFNNAAYLYSKTRENQGVALNVSGTVLPSYEPTLEWMRNGPLVSELEQRVIEAENQVQQFGTDFGARITTAEGTVAALGTQVAGFEQRLDEIESGAPRVYVGPTGTRYENIIVYANGSDNGKAAVSTVGNYYASTEYRFYLTYGGSVSANYWIFRPAYVDTDVSGMRLHYLPTQQKTYNSSTDSGCQYIPRDFYWQNGVVYMVVDSYNGTTWRGTLRMKYAGTGQYNFPNGIYQGSSDTTASYYVHLTFDSREGTIMGTGSGTSSQFGHMKTSNGKYLPTYDAKLWFPEKPTAEQQLIMDWLATFHR